MLLDGVAKLARGAKSLSEDQWQELACGRWSAEDLARHILSLSRSHHRWLDAAISGDSNIVCSIEQMDGENQLAVESLSELSGPDAIAEFVRTAGRYANRVSQHWDLPIGFAGGTSSVGQHCSLIALEYHLHAWDLAHLNSDDAYVPPTVDALFLAARNAQAAQTDGWRKAKLVARTSVRRHHKPWEYLLQASGRIGKPDKVLIQAEPGEVIDLRSDAELPLPVTEQAPVSSD